MFSVVDGADPRTDTERDPIMEALALITKIVRSLLPWSKHRVTYKNI